MKHILPVIAVLAVLLIACQPAPSVQQTPQQPAPQPVAVGEPSPAPVEAPCIEDWSCSAWSPCSNGAERRTCFDRNSCGTAVNKPEDARTCAAPPTPAPGAKELTLEADDYGFYPTNTITAKKGEKVRVTFKVREVKVYYGGLWIKSGYFDTGNIAPGGTATVEFIADYNAKFTSYWPSSGVKKADGKIEVT